MITGCSRREPTVTQWKESLGEYPEEFLHHLDYIPVDLENIETLGNLPNTDDTTYFLSVPPEKYENAIVNLKEVRLLDDPDRSRIGYRKTLWIRS